MCSISVEFSLLLCQELIENVTVFLTSLTLGRIELFSLCSKFMGTSD